MSRVKPDRRGMYLQDSENEDQSPVAFGRQCESRSASIALSNFSAQLFSVQIVRNQNHWPSADRDGQRVLR